MIYKKTAAAFAVSLFAAYASSVLAYQAGTYTASAQSQNGPVSVSVTFSKDKIESVKITEQKETVGIGEVAAPLMAKRIQESQSLAVDSVSGATATSKAVLAAVEDCVKQAKGNLKQLTKKKTNKEQAKTETLTTDLLIIGGGGAGMISAINAADNGSELPQSCDSGFFGAHPKF